MRKFQLLTAIVMLFSTLTFAQNQVITGRITDDKGSPVSFATVTETNSNNSVTSDINGKFTITIKGNQITISAVDHITQTVAVSGNVANVTLARTEGQLKEVVVTALGIRRTR